MISDKTKIAKNASVLVVTDIIIRLLGTILTITIARKLGAADLGLLAFAMAFTTPFALFVGFGFNNLISRDVAQDLNRTGSYIGTIFVIKSIFAVIITLLIIGILALTNYTVEKLVVVCIAGFIMMIGSFEDFFTAFFRAHQKAQYEAIIKIIPNLLSVLSGLIILYLGYDLLHLISVRFLVYLAGFAIGFGLLIKKLAKPSFNFEIDFCKNLVKSAAPFALLGIIANTNVQMGTIILSFMKGDLVTGWFSAAHRLCGVFSFFSMAFVGAVLPAMAKFSQKNESESLTKTYEASIKYLLIFSLPLAVGISILADKFIMVIYGQDYTNSILVLRILIWTLVFSFSNRACMVAFASINQEKKFLRIQIVGVVINLCLNFLLIPIFGQNGVPIATIATEIVILISSIYTLSNRYRDAKLRKVTIKPILAAIIMGVFLLFFRQHGLLFLIPVSALLYGVSLIVLKTFDNVEQTVLHELFGRKILRFNFS